MTPLQKPVRRRCVIPHRGRRLVVSLEPGDLVSLRPEGTRRVEYLSIAAMHDWAVRQRVEAERKSKRAAKVARKAGKS